MRPFAYARADSAQAAIDAQHGNRDASQRRNGSRTQPICRRRHHADRPDEARRDAAASCHRYQRARAHALGRNRVRAAGSVGSARWCACRRPPITRRPQELSCDRAIARARRQSANPQHGLARRQCAATDALHLFPRHLLRRLQQTRTGLRLRGAWKASTGCTRCSASANIASPPIPAISRRR